MPRNRYWLLQRSTVGRGRDIMPYCLPGLIGSILGAGRCKQPTRRRAARGFRPAPVPAPVRARCAALYSVRSNNRFRRA